ncbi:MULTISPECIES: NosD domain-containing protein [unclassified Yoonia]|uniref:NosD domain-containing protein n=1 Tax=unclassified Yoonia TaxID=2629118 RepID=UPI002AFE7A16|nr:MULTISPECIES: right-handed parallel beta-helix repeat-containing protein [unclassified Yoonia]
MLKRLIVLWVVLCVPLSVQSQPMDYAARAQMAAAVADLSAAQMPQTRADAAAAVLDQIGMGWPDLPLHDVAATEFVRTADAVIEMVDIRLILAQIAVQSGARDHVLLTQAQGAGPHDVILLRGGFVGLADLFALSRDTLAADVVIATDAGLVLTRPLAIWSDAGLQLGPEDRLTLARDQGSFIVNLGRLDVIGGTVTGSAAPNLAAPDYRPFMLTAGQGSLTAIDAAFAHLGFGAVPSFGGVAVVNSGLGAAQSASFIVQSQFSDVTSLALIGTSGGSVLGNQITGATGPAISIAGARQSIVAKNILSQLSGPQGIRVSANASDVQIIGNSIAGQPHIGMLIDGGSDTIRISGNLLLGASSTGLAVDDVSCLLVADNLIAANGGAGVSLRKIDAADLRGNAILFNAGAGLMLRDQSMTAQVQVMDNAMIGNREGLRGATPGAPFIAGNDLQGQMPRVFTGDLSGQMLPWLRAQAAAQPVVAARPVACMMAEQI